jgi:hypothetical protein
MKKKKSIPLNPADREALVTMYLDRRLAIDHYAERPKDLRSLTDAFNALTGRSDVPEDILHYMRTQRKNGKWPKLGSTARKVSKSPEEIMALEDSKILEACYIKIGKAHEKGNDSFAYEPELVRELVNEFRKATGRYIHGSQLLAALTIMRKAGNLEKLKLDKHGRREAFGDMDEAANM